MIMLSDEQAQAMHVLVAQAAALRDAYIRNRGSEGEFVATISLQRGCDLHRVWQELDKALLVLDT